MGIYVACCMPDGSCQSLGPSIPFVYDPGQACLAMGGQVYGGATSIADACGHYQETTPMPPGATLCGVGRCTYTPEGSTLELCEEVTYAACVVLSPFWAFFQGLTCPITVARNRSIKAFLCRERAWPYRAEWSMAASGIEYVCCFPGIQDCALHSYEACLELGGQWLPTNFARERGISEGWYLPDPNQQDPAPPAQMARMFLDRRIQCYAQDLITLLPFTTQLDCEMNNGHWKWDGIPFLAPAVGHIFTELRECEKRIKLFQQLGFWFADPATTATGCFHKSTFASLPQYINEPQCSQAGHIWRVGSFVRPPQWSGQIRYSSKTPVGIPSPEHYFKHSKYAEAFPHAAEYQYMVLLPVKPLSAYPSDCCTGGNQCVPYCNDPQAPSKFPFNDTRTYEIPCYTFNHMLGGVTFVDGSPFRNRTWGDGVTTPTVPAGLRAIIAYSPGDARVGSIRNYCGSGCPQDFDCEAWHCEDLWENIYRKYKGITAPRRFEWTDDPEGRGWSVTYITEITSYFVQDSLWDLQPREPGSGGIGNLQPPSFRWNAWYEGETRCIVSGDVNDSSFRAWILSHDSGFGLKFNPRYSACNDVFQKFEGVSKSMGDSVFPSPTAQTQCLDHTTNPSGDPAPCAKVGKLSTWYRPDYTGAPLPHNGLIHETARVRFTNPEQTQSTTEYGWATLAFSTEVPQLIQTV